MKGKLYTLQEYKDKTIEKHESTKRWHYKMTESGVINCTYHYLIASLKKNNYFVFVSDDKKIFLREKK